MSESVCYTCRNYGKVGAEMPLACRYCHVEDDVPNMWQPRAKTNADRIRSMTDEELAELFYKISHEQRACTEVCGNLDKCQRNNAQVPNCRKHFLKWLQRPAEEDT